MNPEMMNRVLKQLVELTVLNAKLTASLLNNGDPFTVAKTEPGSLGLAIELRTMAKDLSESFESLSATAI
jgi:hypothetical protein